MPRLSVITGAYNIANLFSFKKSMESVLSQSFSDFEFIICDDGSTDESYELLSSYLEKDSRIKLIKNEKNLGLAASLNKCLEIARGDFIARHDLDDLSAKDRFEKQLCFLEENPDVSLVGTAAFIFDENGVFGTRRFPEAVTRRDFLFTSPHQHGSVIFKKEALLQVGGYKVSRETRRCEDYELFMRMHRSYKSANLSEALYYFLEDKNALKRRKYKYRIDEAKIRYEGFRKLGLLPYALPYVIKPLLVGLIPICILKRLRKRRITKNFSDIEKTNKG